MGSQIRHIASATTTETRTIPTSKTLKDFRSFQNLTLFATNMQQSESETSHNITISQLKPSSEKSRLPSHELDNKTNDQMSQLTQDFHRPTVELGLESSFTHDVTSSSNEPAEQLSSTGLNENFNVSETTDDLKINNVEHKVIDKTISPQHNDSVFIEEDNDDETADNVVNSTVEMNSFFNENYNHEYSTINAADASETYKPLFQRQDSISSRFSSLSIQMT
ncbi:unnamed protein product [Rotaria sordida]|uniref:Uncharacterized protein n=1 Tax=Rotaria sordida TaxID=392033 RepID=A0A815LYY3_9BILA|nr:unnamed protein product [Rotaria sordida]